MYVPVNDRREMAIYRSHGLFWKLTGIFQHFRSVNLWSQRTKLLFDSIHYIIKTISMSTIGQYTTILPTCGGDIDVPYHEQDDIIRTIVRLVIELQICPGP